MTLKPGPLSESPPSPLVWKGQGGRGAPPQAYDEVQLKLAPTDALEYLIFQGTCGAVKAREIERRIKESEEDRRSNRQRYNKAARYYLVKKLEELVLDDANDQS
jgi:hypothetical protein